MEVTRGFAWESSLSVRPSVRLYIVAASLGVPNSEIDSSLALNPELKNPSSETDVRPTLAPIRRGLQAIIRTNVTLERFSKESQIECMTTNPSKRPGLETHSLTAFGVLITGAQTVERDEGKVSVVLIHDLVLHSQFSLLQFSACLRINPVRMCDLKCAEHCWRTKLTSISFEMGIPEGELGTLPSAVHQK